MAHERSSPVLTGAREIRPTRALQLLALAVMAFAALVAVRVRAALRARGHLARAQAAAAVTTRTARPEPIEVVRPRVRHWRPTVTLEGTLAPTSEADLAFGVAGRVATLSVALGERVRAGQVLARLDAGEAAARLEAARAHVRAAEASAELAADVEQRSNVMVASGAQNRATGVQAVQERRLAEAQRDVARAEEALARRAVEEQVLEAPFAGTVTRLPAVRGAVIGAGTPILHLAALDKLKIIGSVAESEAAFMRVGHAIELRARDDGPVIARGRVTAVVAALDPATRRVPVEGIVEIQPDAGHAPALISGALASATVLAPEPVTALALPAAVLRPGTPNQVLVVSAGRLVARKVAPVLQDDGWLLVRAGLDPGALVVAHPSPDMREGAAVTVHPASAELP